MEIRVFEDKERKEILSKAIAKYGENQLDIAQEELSELIQAISKIKRYPNSKDAQLNLIEEIADVSIMIEQLQMYFGISDEVVQDEADVKLDRLENKMFEEDAIIFYRDYLDKQKAKKFNKIASETTKSTEYVTNEIMAEVASKWQKSLVE